MNVRGVDHRDQSWEQDRAVYRVFLQNFHENGDLALIDSWEVSDAPVIDVIEWARAKAASFHGWEVWVKVEAEGEVGVILLMSERTDALV